MRELFDSFRIHGEGFDELYELEKPLTMEQFEDMMNHSTEVGIPVALKDGNIAIIRPETFWNPKVIKTIYSFKA